MRRILLLVLPLLMVTLSACQNTDITPQSNESSSELAASGTITSDVASSVSEDMSSSSATSSKSSLSEIYVFGDAEAALRKTVAEVDMPLFEKLKSADTQDTKSEMYFFIAGDFDFDGEKEAIGVFDDERSIPNMNFHDFPRSSVRYYDNSEVSYILDECYGMRYSNLQVFVVDGRTLIKVEIAFVTESKSELFWVTSEGLIPSKSDTFQGFYPYKHGGFTMLHSTYDGASDNTGHTWKPYWFFYDESIKDFREYGGIEVDYETLSKVDGFNDVIATFDPEYEFVNAIYRSNGIINFNYRKKSQYDATDGYYNYTALLKDGKMILADNYTESGVYLTNLTENADYPQSFPKQ